MNPVDDSNNIGGTPAHKPGANRARKPGRKVVKRSAAKTNTVKARTPTGTVEVLRRATKHDWPTIRQTFLDGPMDMTLADVATQYGMRHDTVRARASKERWLEQRIQYKAEQAKKHMAQRTEKMLQEAEKFDDDNLQVAQTGLRLVMARLAEIGNHFQVQNARQRAALQRLAQGIPVEREELYTAIRSTEMRELATAAQMFQDIGRKALGVDFYEQQASGAVIADIDVQVIKVADELTKDDPERLSRVFDVIKRAGLQDIFFEEDEDDEDDYVEVDVDDGTAGGVIEGSVVDEEDED